MNANARPRAHTEGVEGQSGVGRKGLGEITFFGGDPAVGVEADACKYDEEMS